MNVELDKGDLFFGLFSESGEDDNDLLSLFSDSGEEDDE
jgi:hypothetical protein